MSNSFGLSKVKHIVAVSSCKGGVGKSTMAAFIALELSKRGLAVGLLDADIHGPSLPTLLNIHNPRIVQDEFKMIAPIIHDGLKVMSFGFLLGDAPAVMRGPMVANYIKQLLLQTGWGILDYLIIDMPPGTGDVQLTITQSARLDGAVIVTTPQTLSLVDVARGILMFEKVSVPILGIIENMAYFVCDKCDKKHYIFGQGKLQERFGVKSLAEIPLQRSMTQDLSAYQADPFIKGAVNELLIALEDQQSSSQEIPDVSFDEHNIRLIWKDGRSVTKKNHDIRANCGCALCVNETTGKKILDPNKIPANIAPKEIAPLGNYALGITWNDGHSSGIYPYNLFVI